MKNTTTLVANTYWRIFQISTEFMKYYWLHYIFPTCNIFFNFSSLFIKQLCVKYVLTPLIVICIVKIVDLFSIVVCSENKCKYVILHESTIIYNFLFYENTSLSVSTTSSIYLSIFQQLTLTESYLLVCDITKLLWFHFLVLIINWFTFYFVLVSIKLKTKRKCNHQAIKSSNFILYMIASKQSNFQHFPIHAPKKTYVYRL